MAASRVTKALVWGTIGTNIYICGKWHAPAAVPREVAQNPTSSAYRAAQSKQREYMFNNYTLSRKNIEEGRWHTLITSAFSHVRLVHLGLNMFMLHEASKIATYVGLGPGRLAVLALGSALGGSFGALFDSYKSTQAGQPDIPGLGASGMVQGMLMATMLAAPWLPMRVMFIPVDISYRMVVVGFLAWDMYNLAEQRTAGRAKESWLHPGSYVGYAAHLGGAVFGAAFYLVSMRRGRAGLPLRFK